MIITDKLGKTGDSGAYPEFYLDPKASVLASFSSGLVGSRSHPQTMIIIGKLGKTGDSGAYPEFYLDLKASVLTPAFKRGRVSGL